MAWLFIGLLVGCDGAESSPAPQTERKTALEAYAQKFEENRGEFLSSWVIDDIHVRWQCLQLFGNLEMTEVLVEGSGYRVTGSDGKKYFISLKTSEKVIEEIRIREDEVEHE